MSFRFFVTSVPRALLLPRNKWGIAPRRSKAPGAVARMKFSGSSLDQIYLHVGPSGDCWTSTELYAAKHLQPDYVKSIPLPAHLEADGLVESLEGNSKLLQQIYDDGKLPEDLLQTTTPSSK